ncbi:MAG TPA: transposase [Candidatus Rifleibacterium sp.]|nr:transposase [Candidatus Rifleibacterium sp.]
MNKRNTYTPEFKTRVVLEILKEEMTLSQIAQKYEVHQNMLTKWKQEFLEHAQGAFKRGKTEAEKELRAEKDRSQELEKLVGQLTYEVDWLKKKSAQFGIKIRKA